MRSTVGVRLLNRGSKRPIQAFKILRRQPVDLVLCELCLPAASGMDLLRRICLEFPGAAVIMITAYATIETATEAINSSDNYVAPAGE